MVTTTATSTPLMPVRPLGASLKTIVKNTSEIYTGIRVATLRENWATVRAEASRGLAFGQRAIQDLLCHQASLPSCKTAASEAVGHLITHARSAGEDNLDAILDVVRKRGNKDPARIETLLNAILANPDKFVADLDFLGGGAEPGPSRRDLLAKYVLGLASRSLVAQTHAEFNESCRRLLRRKTPVQFDLSYRMLRDSLEYVQDRLESTQRGLFLRTLRGESGDTLANACVAAANQIERDLGTFVAVQARHRVAMQQLRSKGQNSNSERLGLLLARSGDLTREATSTFASALVLATKAYDSDPPAVVAKAASLPFSRDVSGGKRFQIAKLSGAKDGQLVAVDGLISAVSAGKTSDKALLSKAVLVDPSSKAAVPLVAVYRHLGHLGLSRGAYVRAVGRVELASKFNKGGIAIVIDVLKRKEAALASWREAFFDLSDAWFHRRPGHLNALFSLSPHRRKRTGQRADYTGAAELIYDKIF